MQSGSEPWIPDKPILEICHCRSETILLTPNSSCEACSAFTHVAACTLARSPIRDPLTEGFSHFVTSMTAPVASGWSGRRVGFAPTGKMPPCHGAHPKRIFGSQFSMTGVETIRSWSFAVRSPTRFLLKPQLEEFCKTSRLRCSISGNRSIPPAPLAAVLIVNELSAAPNR